MPLAIKNVPGDDPAAVSPKVTRPAWAVLALAAVASVLEAITPEMLAFLGDWKGAAYLVVGVLLQVIVGYRAPDPARQTEPPTPTPAPTTHTPTAPATPQETPEPDVPLSVVG